jgi:hypothetical protein
MVFKLGVLWVMALKVSTQNAAEITDSLSFYGWVRVFEA